MSDDPTKPKRPAPTLFSNLEDRDNEVGRAFGNELTKKFGQDVTVQHGPNFLDGYMQTLGEPASATRPTDVTDPAVDPGDIPLTPSEQTVRYYRRMFRLFRSTQGLPVSTGIRQAYAEGNIIPPKNRSEAILDAAVPILVGLGLGAGASLAGRAVVGGVGALEAGSVGGRAAGVLAEHGITSMSAPAGTAFSGAGLADVLGVDLAQGLGRAAIPAGMLAKFGSKGFATEAALADAVGSLGIDIGIGGAFGAGEEAGRRQLGEPVSDEEMASTIGNFAVVGGLLGTIFRLPTAANIARSAFKLRDVGALTDAESILPAGTSVGDYITHQTSNGIRYKYKAGTVRNGEKVGGRYVEADELARSPDIQQARADYVGKIRQRIESTPGGAAAQDQMATASPDKPATVPKNIRDKQSDIQTTGALYAGTARRMIGQQSPEQIQAQLRELRAMLFDPTLPEADQVTVGGRVVALEHALGESKGTTPGQLPFDSEVEAVQRVKKLLPFGTQGVRQDASREIARGRVAFGKRMQQYLDSGFPQSTHEAVSERLDQVETQLNRGFKKGTQGVAQDGSVVELAEDPRYGYALAKNMSKPGSPPQQVDINELTPIPRAGKTVRLKDGKVYDVLTVDPAKGTIGIAEPFKPGATTRDVRTVGAQELVELSESKPQARQHAAEIRKTADREAASSTQEIPPTEAATVQGEPVTVTGVGEKTVKVKTASGEVKTMPREKIVRSTKSKPDVTSRDIVDFAPGTLPDKNHKIVYFVVPRNEAAVFEDAYRSGGDTRRWLNTAHVLPPTPATMGSKLYALEVPSRELPKKLYSARAGMALDALAGKARIGSLSSPIDISGMATTDAGTFYHGRVYRVPDALHAAAVRSERQIQAMPIKEHTAYLRHLVSLHEDINTPIAAAAEKARNASGAASEALESGDDTAFNKAEQARAAAHVETAEAAANEDLRSILARAQAFAGDPGKAQFAREGLNSETAPVWAKMLDELPETPNKQLPDKELMLSHSKVPGARVVVGKYTHPAIDETGKPTVRTVYRVTPYGPDSPVHLPDGVHEFDTPGELTVFLKEQGFDPRPTTLFQATFVGDASQGGNPSLHMDIRPNPKTGKITATKVERVAGPARQEGRLITVEHAKTGTKYQVPLPNTTSLSEKAHAFLVSIGKTVDDVPTGMTYYLDQGTHEFDSMEDAIKFARANKFSRIPDKTINMTYQSQFKALPTVDSIRGNIDELRGLEDHVEQIIKQSSATGRIPEPVYEYAQNFAEAYEDALHKPAYDRYARKIIGKPTASDIGPRQSQVVFETLGMAKQQTIEEGTPWDEVVGNYDEDPSYGMRVESPYERTSAQPPAEEPKQVMVSREPGSIEVEKRLSEQGEKPGIVHEQVPVEGGRNIPKTVLPSDQQPPGAQKFHLGGQDTGYTPEDAHIVYTALSDYSRPPLAKTLQLAQNIQQTLADQTERTKAFARSVLDVPNVHPSTIGGLRERIAIYKPTGQAVEIVSTELTGNSVNVRFPEDGKIMSVPWKDSKGDPLVEISHNKLNDAHTYRMAEALADGRYADYLRGPTPMGLGKVEQALGLFGTTSRRVVENAFANRAMDLAKDIKVLRNGHVSGPQESLDELLDLFNRGQELQLYRTESTPGLTIKGIEPTWGGETKQVVLQTSEPGVAQLKGVTHTITKVHSIGDTVLDAMKVSNPKLFEATAGREFGPFQWAAYQRARGMFGDTPLGDLQAKALAGILEPHQEELLRGWAATLELSQNVSPARIVFEAIQRKMIDPKAADLAAQFSREAGFIRFARDAELPWGDVKIVMPRIGNDIGLSSWFAIPSKLMSRHPQSRLLWDLTWAARDEEVQARGFLREFLGDLEKQKYTNDDFIKLRKIMQTHDTWDAASKAGENVRYQYGFERMKEFFDTRKEDLIRQFLRRKIEPVTLDLGKGKTEQELTPLQRAHRQFLISEGLDLDKVDNNVMVRVSNPDSWHKYPISPNGEVPSGLTEDEISTFMELKRQYPDAASLPDLEGMGIRKEAADQFKRTFNYWKSYGIKNYWPLVHEGNMVITVNRNGVDQVLGWAQNLPDIHDSLLALAEQGKLSPQENITISEHKPHMDDIIVEHTNSREYQKFIKEMAKQVEYGPDETRALIFQAQRQDAPTVRPPFNVHMETRKANLEPPIPDPLKELSIYNARIARMNYRWKVMQAYRLYNDPVLGRSLADSHKVPMIQQDMPNMDKYIKNFVSRALGERTVVEEKLDQVLAVGSWITHAPGEVIKNVIGGKQQIPLSDILDWNKGPKLFARPFAARRLASDVISLQSKWRLFGSIGSAVANATQFGMTGIPSLIDDQMNMVQATALGMKSWWEAGNIWRTKEFGNPETLSADMKHMVTLLDRAGANLQPIKTEAGGGLGGGWAMSTQKPSSLGRSKLDYGERLVSYYGMIGFNGTEAVNRYATGIAAIRKALSRGLGDDVAVESARDLIRKTQFLYDELDMPQMLAAGGPVSRVLFQFKPFLMNMMGYEADLIKNAMSFDPVALQQLATHMGALTVFGGAVGLAHHPVMSVIGGAAKLAHANAIGDFLLHPEETVRGRRRQNMSPEEIYANSMHYQASDLLYYGLPGLLHLSLGQRAGVSGQDLQMLGDTQNIFGPQMGVYSELFKTWRDYAKQGGSTAGLIGGALGAIAPSFIPTRGGKLLSEISQFPVGYPRALSAIGLGWLFSAHSQNPFGDYLQSSEEGRSLFNKAGWTAVRNFARGFAIAHDGTIRDIDGKPQYIPVNNRVEETALAAAGIPSIRREEYSAAVGLLKGDASDMLATRRTYIERVAQAWAKNDWPHMYQILAQANSLGIDIPESAIQEELNSMTNESMETTRARLPVATRYNRQ